MKQINLMVQEELLTKLKALSEKTGAPVSELIRRAIQDYLKKRK
jgi:metal-responsive CopG/Arc/MetJ family transcriptional regulator